MKIKKDKQGKDTNTIEILSNNLSLNTILESLTESVVIIDESGKILFINKKLSLLTGFDQEEIINENLNSFVPINFHHKHNMHVKEFFNDPHIRPMGVGYDLTVKRKDGTTFPVEISLSFIKTDKEIIGIAFLTDITTRKKAENELKKRNKELDAYAHTVAHDLNSSLTGIIGYSDLILNSEDLPKEELNTYLKHIVNSGMKMTNIIKELLMFASIKKENIEIALFRMRGIIESACKRLKYQIDEKSVTVNIDDNIIDCNSYSAWIEEIWYNYISNAIKYGGNPPILDIYSEKTDNGFIKYCVKDNGEGLPKKLHEIIFDNKSIKRNKYIKGHGLGLSIVKRIAEKLDGYVSVESDKGNGCVFSFFLKEQTLKK